MAWLGVSREGTGSRDQTQELRTTDLSDHGVQRPHSGNADRSRSVFTLDDSGEGSVSGKSPHALSVYALVTWDTDPMAEQG